MQLLVIFGKVLKKHERVALESDSLHKREQTTTPTQNFSRFG